MSDNKAPVKEKEGTIPPNSLDGEEITDKTITIDEYTELQEIKQKYNELLDEQRKVENDRIVEEQKKEAEKLKQELNDLKEQNKKILEAQEFELEKTKFLISNNIDGIGTKMFEGATNLKELEKLKNEFELWIQPFIQKRVNMRINESSYVPPNNGGLRW